MEENRTTGEVVVLVHGLWISGAGLLCRRFREAGFEPRKFGYRGTRDAADAAADRLFASIRSHPEKRVHLLGYSLGGLLVYHALHRYGVEWPQLGRVILLGSPLRSSAAALQLSKSVFGRKMLGDGVSTELLSDPGRCWTSPYPAAAIAGTRGVGLGRLLCRLDKPNDGTVAVSETKIPGLADHAEVEAGHAGLLFARRTVTLAASFFRSGTFESGVRGNL